MCGTDSQTVIDSLEFAKTAQRLSGRVEIAKLARLSEHLFDSSGALDFSMAGGNDSRQRPRLHIEVRGEIILRCQRCLERLPYPVSTVSDLLVLSGEAGTVQNIEDLDGVAANSPLILQDLVEDEVLLALPIVPRHPAGECSVAPDEERDDAGNASPFAVLKQLKRN